MTYGIAICTAAYPQSDLQVEQYVRAAAAALSTMPDAAILIVAEAGYARPDLRELESFGARLHYVSAKSGGVAALRGQMFAAARNLPAEALMFIDYDDMVVADALSRMRDALSADPIAYGDLLIADADGKIGEDCAFGYGHLPRRIDRADMLFDENCLGFSNTAVRRSILLEEDEQVPDALVAVDWWLFTRLMLRGHTGVAVTGPVSAYRQYAGNTLGASRRLTATELGRRLLALEAHYRSFVPADWAAQRLQAIAGYSENPAALNTLLRAMEAEGDSRWWFGNIVSAARRLAQNDG